MKPRPRPLGVQSHSEWDGVWVRYIELSDAQEADAANDNVRPDHDPDALPRTGFVALVILVVCVGMALVGAIR